jgi:hypothetical protein
MSRLNPEKLHVRFSPGTRPDGPPQPRCYTLTHSDFTADLYLTVGAQYDRKQVSGLYTRLMRDEVLAEWRQEEAGPVLHVHCHVSGGLTFGWASLRDAIFRQELPLALEALRYGDQELYKAQRALDLTATVRVHFHSRDPRYDRVEDWGRPADYAGALARPAATAQGAGGGDGGGEP